MKAKGYFCKHLQIIYTYYIYTIFMCVKINHDIEGTRNLPLKFGQNLVTNCLDIPDMDKCRQDK